MFDLFQQRVYRHELKYICSIKDLAIIENRIMRIMQHDANTYTTNGEYLIRSVYFDDYKHGNYLDNENGVDPREKYRIRIYNKSKERIALEKKIKRQGMTAKDICLIDLDTCERMLKNINISSDFRKDSLVNEWITHNRTELLSPVMLGEYVRRPYVYKLGNVRITFDMNITASRQISGLFEGHFSRIPILSTGYHIMEVKYTDFLPDEIYELIDMGHLLQTTFSKFYLGCKALRGELYEL